MMKKKRKEERSPLDVPVESGEEAPPEQPQADRPAPDRSDVRALAAERDDLLARLQRVSADYVNYQKRVQREIAEASDFANANLIRELLPVLDDMERAMEAAQADHSKNDSLLKGMQLVYDKALEILGRRGLVRIEAEGQPFDPTRHEAMMQQPSGEHESPTVLTELQRGYEFGGRVLRPARAIVSAPPDPPPAADAASEPPEEDDQTESE